jgi:hypothetical protein
MTGRCPHADEFLLLRDGELSENRARAVREHVADCPACRSEADKVDQIARAVAAPVAGAAVDRSVERLLERLDDRDVPDSVGLQGRSRSGRRLVLAGTVAFAATAAAFVLFPYRSPSTREGVFEARGGGSTAPAMRLRRDVGLTLYKLVGDTPVPLVAGAAVFQDDKLVASVRNIHRGPAVYLLLFAVDAAHAVHWLYPAFEAAGDDPPSATIPYRERETLMATSVVLDTPRPGPLRVVALWTEAPLHVSVIESLPATQLDVPALQGLWPEASVMECPLTVRASENP